MEVIFETTFQLVRRLHKQERAMERLWQEREQTFPNL